MKITTYNQSDVPTDKDADIWMHFIYIDSSGWVGITDNGDLGDLDTVKAVISQMEHKSGMENGLDWNEIQSEIDGYSYRESEIGELTKVIVASPCRGEETIFIFS